jgi:hypothetical protein
MPGEIGRHRNEGEMYVRENIRMQMEPGAEREARVEKAESCSDSRSETGHSYGGRRKEGHTTRDEKMWGLVKIRDLRWVVGGGKKETRRHQHAQPIHVLMAEFQTLRNTFKLCSLE